MSRVSHNPKNDEGKATGTTAKARQHKSGTGEKRRLPFRFIVRWLFYHILIVNQNRAHSKDKPKRAL